MWQQFCYWLLEEFMPMLPYLRLLILPFSCSLLVVSAFLNHTYVILLFLRAPCFRELNDIWSKQLLIKMPVCQVHPWFLLWWVDSWYSVCPPWNLWCKVFTKHILRNLVSVFSPSNSQYEVSCEAAQNFVCWWFAVWIYWMRSKSGQIK